LRAAVVVGLITLVSSTSIARDAVVTPGNADQWTISRRVSDIKAMAQYCSKMECPEIDCAAANKVIKALEDAKTYVSLMKPWLQDASSLYLGSIQSTSEQGQITGAQCETLLCP